VDDILDVHERGRKNFAVLHGVEAARRYARRQVESARRAVAFLGKRGRRLMDIAESAMARNA